MKILFDPSDRKSGLFGEVNENIFSKEEIELLLGQSSKVVSELQLSYYLHGNLDQPQRFPISIEEMEALAKEALGPYIWSYIGSQGVAGNGETYRANLSAFSKYPLLPKMATGASSKPFTLKHQVDFGQFNLKVPSPIFVAPMGVQTLNSKGGELVSSQASHEAKASYMYSSASAYSPEEVRKSAPDADLFFQLYASSIPEINLSLIDRAMAAGYRGIALTLDTAIYPIRERELELGYLPFIWKAKRESGDRNHGFGLFLSDPVSNSIQSKMFNTVAHPDFVNLPGGPYPISLNHAILLNLASSNNSGSVVWDEEKKEDPFAMDWFVNEITTKRKLPLILKGILRVDDAIKAVRKGVSGVYVSNHGGRQVDGAITSIDALKPIAEAVRLEAERLKIPKPAVLFDSGIRRGSDIVKAYALGADWVGVGRPVLYGLAVGGKDGVKHVLDVLLADMISATKNVGYTSVSQLSLTDIFS